MTAAQMLPLTRAEHIRIMSLSMAIAATPMIVRPDHDVMTTQAALVSRAADFEIFIKAAREDA